jgi:GTP-binding protein HflX
MRATMTDLPHRARPTYGLDPEGSNAVDVRQAPSTGDLDLEERGSLRRVAGLSTELVDVTEVEYRQLRLERVVLVGVWTEGTSEQARASMTELARLAETAGSQVLDGLIQRRGRPDPATFIGSGKVLELADAVRAAGADTVICDGELSPGQLRQLEDKLKVKVIDRTALILDIFAQHARSRDGKAQVELAQLSYLLPRLRGWGEALSRQVGGRAAGGVGIGGRGPGETKIELDRRRIRNRMSKLRRDIKAMRQVRETQRGERRRHDVPSVAIVGYTNAGKSSLLNALTGAGVLVEDALFATLDPTTRRAVTADGRAYTLTDTVGFVRHLPHQLVEAFRSTLEETAGADLLIHVVDASDPLPEDQIKAVRQVLVEIGEEHGGRMPHELLVVNKTDTAGDLALARLRHLLPDAVFVSAQRGDGIARLRARIADLLPSPELDVELLLPYTEGALASRVHAEGEVLAEEHTAEGTRLHARVGAELAAAVLPFARAGTAAGVDVPPAGPRLPASASRPDRGSAPSGVNP